MEQHNTRLAQTAINKLLDKDLIVVGTDVIGFKVYREFGSTPIAEVKTEWRMGAGYITQEDEAMLEALTPFEGYRT